MATYQRTLKDLWKNESYGSSELYVDLLSSFDIEFGANPQKVERAPIKSNIIANEFRAAGNRFFELKSLSLAIEIYNESLRHAENGTESLGLAYANRATCFLHIGKEKEMLG